MNFYVNFLSSRKYDWNVALRDLEKYGAPTAHASYFFKKNESLFTSTTTIKKNKQYFFKLFSSFISFTNKSYKYFVVFSK